MVKKGGRCVGGKEKVVKKGGRCVGGKERGAVV